MVCLFVWFAFILIYAQANNKTVECKYGTTKHEKLLKEVYTCTAEDRKNSSNITSQNVVGNHIENHSDNSVTFLNINNYKCDIFPLEFHVFNKLEGVEAINIGLLRIEEKDLETFTELKYLNLHDNQITVLGKKLFSKNSKLQFIDISINRLVYIDPHIFDDLKSLKRVNFKNRKDNKSSKVFIETNETKIFIDNLRNEFTEEPEFYIAKSQPICKPLVDKVEGLQKNTEEKQIEVTASMDELQKQLKHKEAEIKILLEERPNKEQQFGLAITTTPAPPDSSHDSFKDLFNFFISCLPLQVLLASMCFVLLDLSMAVVYLSVKLSRLSKKA